MNHTFWENTAGGISRAEIRPTYSIDGRHSFFFHSYSYSYGDDFFQLIAIAIAMAIRRRKLWRLYGENLEFNFFHFSKTKKN